MPKHVWHEIRTQHSTVSHWESESTRNRTENVWHEMHAWECPESQSEVRGMPKYVWHEIRTQRSTVSHWESESMRNGAENVERIYLECPDMFGVKFIPNVLLLAIGKANL